MKKLHGLRHTYAQRRYRELTGWEAPINAGKLRREMTEVEKQKNIEARRIISSELGHSRIAITWVYCGK